MLPVYQQITRDIESAITKGTYEPGHRLPTQGVLADRYRVSTKTVGTALKILRDKGLIHIYHGLGAYVAGKAPRRTTYTLPAIFTTPGSTVTRDLLHQQIATHLRVAIAKGEYEPGDVLPSLRTLADQFQVSTQPVRTALNTLHAKGQIRLVPGGGAYVAEHENSSPE